MVGIVIVSHSRPLAQAVVNLVRQMASKDVPFALAAGVGDRREEFGTDAVEIAEAIQSVHSPDGVLVLMDLGSAILSAEMALELLPEDFQESVRFCPAPLVEGAVAAGVQAGLGSSLEEVYREAKSALLPKLEHLSPKDVPAIEEMTPAKVTESVTDIQEVVLTIKNLHGLHARPAARFVQTASMFNADIRVKNITKHKGPVSAKSLNSIATLGAVKDHQIVLSASGPEADQALKALSGLIESAFGEETEAILVSPEQPEVKQVSAGQTSKTLVVISEGVALGPLFRYRAILPLIPDYPVQDSSAEWANLQTALEKTRLSIKQRRQSLASALGEEQVAIFDAHLMILQDPELLEQVRLEIFDEMHNAAAAWKHCIDMVVDSYRAIDDVYLKQRAVDVEDVGNQVLLSLLTSDIPTTIQLHEPVILFAEELTPTETAQLDMSQVLGVMTVTGGPTSHSAILARALGIPAVSGVDPMIERVADGTMIGLDAFEGGVWVDPQPDVQKRLVDQRNEWLAQRKRLLQSAQLPASTKDGRKIEIAANIGNAQDAKAAVENGAEGVGLLRTEFLFLTRTTAPTEAEQVFALRQIGDTMGNKPVIVRTLDVGGDKELPYIQLPPEPNPFLGVRAIRLSLRKPELFQTQLRSILRAGMGAHFRIMFPMVANPDEVVEALRCLEQAHESLQAEGLTHAWPIETGIMIEVPAAAIQSEILAQIVDFFSIGTNDLTQYTLAAERGNPNLSEMADALHPAVLQLIQQVAKAAHKYGKWTGVCGELAGDPLAVPVLVGLGVDELSMNPGSISRAKAILRLIESEQAEKLAASVLKARSTKDARQIARQFYQQEIEAYL